jgi:hypothetical protein
LYLKIQNKLFKWKGINIIYEIEKIFFTRFILRFMEPAEEKRIIQEIISNRRLPYSIELLEVNGDKYTVRGNFGSNVTYIKKGENYFLEDEL